MPEGLNKNEVFGRIADLEISPLEYYKLVNNFNILLQHELSRKLEQHKGALGNAVTFVTPGSDARLEKGSFMSPLEVIGLVDSSVDLGTYESTLAQVVGNMSPAAATRILEIKGPDAPLAQAYGRYQPGRIADARLIYGSEEKLQESKIKLGQEIIGMNNDQVDKISKLKREARKVTSNGVNRLGGVEAVHFDLASGSIFFNPEAHQLSFKIGPLRLVQNSLLIEEVKHTRRTNDPNFIRTLDASIVGRLRQLSDDGMINISKATAEEVAEHYAFFLRLYHRSERAYGENGQIVMQLSAPEIAEVAKRLQALSKIMENFQIAKQPK